MTAPGSNPMARWLEDVWLSRYLDRELNDDEHAWFETYMLDKPHILERVDADTRLGDSLARASELPSAAKVSTPPHQSGTTLRGKPRGPALAVAASLLLGLGIGVVIPGLRNDNTTVVASPPRIVFDTMRGESSETVEEGDVNSSLLIVEMAVPLEAVIAQSTAVIEGRQVQLPIPKVSAEGFVTFVVPNHWRHRGRIELKLHNSPKEDFRTSIYTL
jgi:hypothetical protein